MINESAKDKYRFDINEVGLSELEARKAGITTQDFGDYKTSIVVLGRVNSEGRDYLPGEDGLKGTGVGENNEGAKDPLGLSNREREMIKMAKEKGDKTIVLINSNSPMEIDELKKDDGIDAILWIGTTGTYGMTAVPQILFWEDQSIWQITRYVCCRYFCFSSCTKLGYLLLCKFR